VDLLKLHIPPAECARHVAEIGEIVLRQSKDMRSPNFDALHTDDLHRLFDLYDHRFFDGWLSGTVQEKTGAPLGFRLSPTMTRAGGKMIHKRRRLPGSGGAAGATQSRMEIAIGTHLLFMTFREVEREVMVGGILCEDRLAALQRIVEHEIIHLAEILAWDESSCSAARFKSLVKNIFGHTQTKHQLITPREHAAVTHNIRVGQTVEFNFEGVRHVGVVNRIHHRATVLVASVRGTRYSDGKKYLKFYIPLPELRAAT